MNFFDFSFWKDFVSNLSATLLGVALGIPIALWISRFQERRTEKERKRNVLEKLKKELLENLKYLRMREDEKLDIDHLAEALFFASGLKDEVYRVISDGGELEWIKDLDLLETISSAYYFIRDIKFRGNLYLELLKSNKENYVEARLFNRIEGSLEIIPRVLHLTLLNAVDEIDMHLKKEK